MYELIKSPLSVSRGTPWHVYRVLGLNRMELVAACTTREAAEAARRLLSMLTRVR